MFSQNDLDDMLCILLVAVVILFALIAATTAALGAETGRQPHATSAPAVSVTPSPTPTVGPKRVAPPRYGQACAKRDSRTILLAWQQTSNATNVAIVRQTTALGRVYETTVLTFRRSEAGESHTWTDYGAARRAGISYILIERHADGTEYRYGPLYPVASCADLVIGPSDHAAPIYLPLLVRHATY